MTLKELLEELDRIDALESAEVWLDLPQDWDESPIVTGAYPSHGGAIVYLRGQYPKMKG